MNESIREYYLQERPDDELGIEIDGKVTFQELYDTLGIRVVYEVIGVFDSIVREILFQRLSELCGVEYNVIYEKWRGKSDF